MKKQIVMLLVVGMVVALAGTANAAPVSLTNASFEDPDAGFDGFIVGAPTGWVIAGGANVLVIDENRDVTPDTDYGDQWVDLYHIDGQQLGQSIGTGLGLLGQQIDLSYIVARRTNEDTATDHNVMIVAGSGSTFVGGTVLDTAAYSTVLPNMNTYNTVALSLDASGSVGSNTQLWLVFEQDLPSGGDGQLLIDNVEASATPEPATMSLLALGGLGILARRRRRRS